jgi:hypothetical protein
MRGSTVSQPFFAVLEILEREAYLIDAYWVNCFAWANSEYILAHFGTFLALEWRLRARMGFLGMAHQGFVTIGTT